MEVKKMFFCKPVYPQLLQGVTDTSSQQTDYMYYCINS